LRSSEDKDAALIGNTDQRKIAAIIFLLQVIESLEDEHSAHQRLQNK
jgi:hypothetical protein